MTAYLAVSLIVSLAMSAFSAGISINQLSIASKNQQLKDIISGIVSIVNKQIASGRLSLNKIISLLQSRNQNALMNYLMNNPVISKNLKGIQNDSDIIASIQSEQNSLESEIATLQNEINYLGYSQSQKGTEQEKARLASKQRELNQATDKYQKLVEKAKGISISTTNPITTVTSDIDARSQNINGGLHNG